MTRREIIIDSVSIRQIHSSWLRKLLQKLLQPLKIKVKDKLGPELINHREYVTFNGSSNMNQSESDFSLEWFSCPIEKDKDKV